MNSVTVIGSTKSLRELSEEVAYWCIGELMPRYRTLEIEIQLSKCADEGGWGFCYAMETERDFTIEIDKRIPKIYAYEAKKDKKANEKECARLGREAFIETICHEMVHVWQTASGVAQDRVYPKKLGYRKLWKGKDYTDTAYSKQPWERQAFRMQGQLLKKYLKAEESS
jgi:hypothetical protein|tara:strand:- start:353 stop:859 length:507 start_codon:yes stop_codon:yes gene_type:complete